MILSCESCFNPVNPVHGFLLRWHPLNTSWKQLLLGIDGHDVRPQRTNASIQDQR